MEHILKSAEIKELFLKVLKRTKRKYQFAIINFCVMGNHIHLIIKPLGQENLSRIMQWILSVFAVAYNKRLNLKGHVWYDRFKSFILCGIAQFVSTFKYIAQNPVKAGLSNNAAEYAFGGVWHLMRKIYDLVEPPGIILKRFLPELFAKK
jgi:putative transposase